MRKRREHLTHSIITTQDGDTLIRQYYRRKEVVYKSQKTRDGKK